MKRKRKAAKPLPAALFARWCGTLEGLRPLAEAEALPAVLGKPPFVLLRDAIV